ncbi:hypothetical protein ZIOFF_069026 [Zingiber officinale]|uniref:Uncharacterized protein n=1 Tax=Zingiber officinale TaxID=94328 RepID=A0A8J5CB78_ZINOF|nr:hypothetical protein ZIOFF_069026 [Zingiber officinale]
MKGITEMEEILDSATLTKLRLDPARFALPLGSGNVNQRIAFTSMNHDNQSTTPEIPNPVSRQTTSGVGGPLRPLLSVNRCSPVFSASRFVACVRQSTRTVIRSFTRRCVAPLTSPNPLRQSWLLSSSPDRASRWRSVYGGPSRLTAARPAPPPSFSAAACRRTAASPKASELLESRPFWSARKFIFVVSQSVLFVGEVDSGDVQPESLFMKELKRRGLDPTTLLEEGDGGASIGPLESKEESSGGEGNGGSTKRNGVASAELEKKLSDQRELSMSLNSEGLEDNNIYFVQGLIPRAKVLLTIGGTFFLGFGPVMLVIFALFLALYIYLGPSFVHDASNRAPVSSPPHVDPYALLEEESLSQVAPNLY